MKSINVFSIVADQKVVNYFMSDSSEEATRIYKNILLQPGVMNIFPSEYSLVCVCSIEENVVTSSNRPITVVSGDASAIFLQNYNKSS